MNGVLKWLEEESERLFEECNSNADPYKSVNNSFIEGFNYALANVQGLEQPQLSENQQIVVNDVKQDHENYGIPKFNAIHLAFTTYATGYYKDHLKNDEEFYQVLSTLIAWAQEQEEE